MQFVDKILFQINTEIEKLGIDDCMGIDSALHMMRFIQPLCDELRTVSYTHLTLPTILLV